MQKNGSNRYTLLLEAKEKKVFNKLVYAGVINCNVANWIDIYEVYLSMLKSNNKTVSISETAEYFNTSERKLYRIISYMEK
jgi:predicted flavoprotein YhiN